MIVRGRTMPRLIGLSVLVLAASLSACSSSGQADSTVTTHGTQGAPPSRALNVTPCNYAQVWLNDPSHFREFATLARFARAAANADLRSAGRQLGAAVTANDSSTITAVINRLAITCEHLGLVHSTTTTSTTTTH